MTAQARRQRCCWIRRTTGPRKTSLKKLKARSTGCCGRNRTIPTRWRCSRRLQAQKGRSKPGPGDTGPSARVRPDDPHIAGVEQAIRVGSMDPDGSGGGTPAGARGPQRRSVARYRRLFQGATPPTALAVEYYQTLSGTEGGWEAARAGLAQFAARLAARHAGATCLRATAHLSRADPGGRRPAAGGAGTHAETSAAAAKAWRQALEWMPINTVQHPCL